MATGHHSSLDIFQDTDSYRGGSDPYDHALKNLKQLLEFNHAANDSPFLPQSSKSPVKRQSPKSNPTLDVQEVALDSVRFPPPDMSFPTDSPGKKYQYAPYFPAAAPAESSNLFASFPSAASRSLDELPSSSLDSNGHGLKVSSLQPSSSGDETRSTGEAARHSISESNIKAPHQDMRDRAAYKDDANVKPPWSYAQIIAEAIRASPNERLTLDAIYKSICERYAYYRNLPEGSGWKNSIRHNLSLNKGFEKRDRPRDKPGKGHEWIVLGSFEPQLKRDRSNRYSMPETGVFSTHSRSSTRPATAPSRGAGSMPRKSVRTVDSSKFPSDTELSSDATIPASDPLVPLEDHSYGPDATAFSMGPPRRSSPPLDLTSSPPVARSVQPCTGTSPHGLAPARGRKRGFDSFRDSGYQSSIDSSVPRVMQPGPLLPNSTMEREHKRIRQGQAQDEIRRMRSSSFDRSSPVKRWDVPKKGGALPSNLSSSSPLRFSPPKSFPDESPDLPHSYSYPLPPPTVSPDTHLRLFRKDIEGLTGLPNEGVIQENWTPAEIAMGDGEPFSSPRSNDVGKDNTHSDFLKLKTPQMPSSSSKKTSNCSTWSNSSLLDPANPLVDLFSRGSPLEKKVSGNRNAKSHDQIDKKRPFSLASPFGSPGRMSPPKKLAKPNSDPFLGYDDRAAEMARTAVNPSPVDEQSSFNQGNSQGMDLLQGFKAISAAKADKENAPATARQPPQDKKTKLTGGQLRGGRPNRMPLQKRFVN